MRILVISDTHRKLERFWEIFEKLQRENPVEMIVHCGDYYDDAMEIRRRSGMPVVAARGNGDGEFSQNGYTILETEAGDFLVTHGHMEHVGRDLQNLYYKALENNCIGAIFGHTHRSAYVDLDGIYLMNPGSLPKPRDGSGGTFGILETSQDNVWGKIYRYEDFISKNNSGTNSSKGSEKKTKVSGGKLRNLLNYSDRF
jgi:putative phosphoesterase